MREMIAVFKSRREAIAYARALTSKRVPCQTMATPRSLGSSCGLSVRFPLNAYGLAESLISAGEYYTFQGFYQS